MAKPGEMTQDRKHTSLLVFGLGGYLKASPVGEVLDNESTYVVVGIAFDPHVAAVFTWQMTGMWTLQRAADIEGGLTGGNGYYYFSLGFGSVLSLLGIVAFAFAGARVGYLVAHPSVIDAMRLVRLPYHLSALTQVAASAALEFSDELLATVQGLIAAREDVASRLEQLGLEVVPSCSNFLLFSGFKRASADVW